MCIRSEPANFTEAEEWLVLEPTVDAITRMSQFIGEREYKTNFLEEIKNAAQLEKLGPQLWIFAEYKITVKKTTIFIWRISLILLQVFIWGVYLRMALCPAEIFMHCLNDFPRRRFLKIPEEVCTVLIFFWLHNLVSWGKMKEKLKYCHLNHMLPPLFIVSLANAWEAVALPNA